MTDAAPPPARSHLDAPERHPLRPLPAGPVAVVAPHPDDETLACGGLLASLAAAGVPARVVVVTDGTGSHPNSPSYPPARLRALREAETRDALAELGLPAHAATFLGLPDGRLAHLDDAEPAVGALARVLAGAATVVAPWADDPHPDHVATAALVGRACARLAVAPRRVSYAVWAYVRGLVPPTGGAPWRLDVRAHRAAKRRAVARHRSQTTALISDDPGGFTLSAEVLAHFDRDWELFWDEPA